jgi:hypothetical protein
MKFFRVAFLGFASLLGLLVPVQQGLTEPRSSEPAALEVISRTLGETVHARKLLADRLDGILKRQIELVEEDELAVKASQLAKVLVAARLADAPLSRRQGQLTAQLGSLDMGMRDRLDALEAGRARVVKALQTLRELGVPIEDVELSWWSTETAPASDVPTNATSGSIDDALSTVGTGAPPRGPGR